MFAELTPERVAEWVSSAPWLLAAVAFLAEDVACLVAGVLIAGANLPATTALVACALGTLVGDLVLWAVARVIGPSLLSMRFVQRAVSPDMMAHVAHRLVDHAPRLILSGRVVPGLRVPVFVALGASELAARRFVLWASVAACVWALGMVGLGMLLGQAAFAISDATPWIAATVLTLTCLVLIRALRRAHVSDLGGDSSRE